MWGRGRRFKYRNFLDVMSPWSRTILRRCSGGISSCFESMYPNFFLSEYRLEFSFCHFRAFSSKIASRCSALIVDAMMPLIHTSLKSQRYQLVHAQYPGKQQPFFYPAIAPERTQQPRHLQPLAAAGRLWGTRCCAAAADDDHVHEGDDDCTRRTTPPNCLSLEPNYGSKQVLQRHPPRRHAAKKAHTGTTKRNHQPRALCMLTHIVLSVYTCHMLIVHMSQKLILFQLLLSFQFI
jgi:hypothetical protein